MAFSDDSIIFTASGLSDNSAGISTFIGGRKFSSLELLHPISKRDTKNAYIIRL